MKRACQIRLVACTLMSGIAGLSFAEEATYELEIAPQPLAQALKAFAEQSGLQVVYYSELAEGEESPAVTGTMTAGQAMDRILTDTGLTYEVVDDDTLVIESRATATELPQSGKSRPASRQELMARTPAQQNPARSRTGTAQIGSAERNTPSAIEEIVVTAQIREQDLQDVPVSATVFSGAQLEMDRLEAIDDIARFTPGLTASFFNNTQPIIAVRGANNTFSQAGASKPVGVFIDGVFVARYSVASFDLFDLQQVAVLRGPQGTLFGRNVTGGAIQIVTERPSLEQSQLKFKAGAANYDGFEVAGLASAPLSDSAAGKLSFSYKERDGFAFDRFNGRRLDDLESLNLRGSLLFTPTDDVEVMLSADYSKDENGGRSYTFVSSNDGADLTGNDGDIRTAELRVPQTYERDIGGISAHVDWKLGAGTINSITAFRSGDAREQYSLGAADVTLPSVATQSLKDETDEPTALSQELRFISNPSDRFDYIVGLYYYAEDIDRRVGDVLLGAGGAATFVDRVYDVNVETKSVAAYADATFHFGERVDLSLGGRYTTEDKDVRVDFTDNNVPAANFLVTPGDDFSEFTPRAALTFHVGDRVALFASRTEGFTAGGFNTETNSATAIQLGFAPETITAYELGAKTAWLDRRVIANLTLFRQEFENKQEGFFNPAGPFFSIFNASEATMEGAEFELQWQLSDALRYSMTYAVLDTVYDDFVIPGADDFSGNKLQTAPEATFSAAFDYTRPIREGTLLAGLSYSWQDEYFTGASNSPDFLSDSYALLNARVGYEWGQGRWRIDLWGKNLADEDFVRIRGTSGAIAEYYGPPRTYGLSFTYMSR
jgi:iron complex outermembrane recepter protein